MNKVIISFILVSSLIFSVICFAGGFGHASGFIRITPETITKYDIKLSVVNIPSTDKYKITLQDNYLQPTSPQLFIQRLAWIVLTKHPLKKEEQNFIDYFNNTNTKSHPEILLASRISVDFDEAGKSVVEIILDKSQLNNAYIFVGYSRPINDGGKRYTIDINSFYKK